MTTKKTNSAPPAPEPSMLMYVGPQKTQVPTLRPGTVYNGGLPSLIKDAIKKVPQLEMLIVDIDLAPMAKKQIATPGSELNAAYMAVQKESFV